MSFKGIVKIWEEDVTIPTYGVGKPEKNPIFLENRVYQGSSGAVYPHPVIEKIEDEKHDKIYHAVFLENQYLKIMILPELGGRVQMAYDKIKQRHFIYYNQVIKPALVGLTGPWISGGIEFNWPQHHRPSTFDSVDFTLEEHEDGSKTVWVSEVERMFRTKGMAGFRLYPDKAYLEINAKLYNRTPFPQTFLWWANPAVKVNDHYQSVFPPDVHAVFDHGKRDVSEFPIARGTYYKVDYSAGVDISRYKNIPVPTSYMAVKSKYNFMGGYEHDTKGGLLHVANHHVSPGKKQWTWGHGDFGRAWDRNLTDEDGPYIELMTGVFTDNQPDFSWIQPFEERTFTQYFMPYSELGVVKNASHEAMVNLELEGSVVHIKFYTTALYKEVYAFLKHHDIKIWSEKFSISPGNPFVASIELPQGILPHDLHIALHDRDGRVLIDYTPEMVVHKAIPDPAKAAKLPNEIGSIEQLYLTGLHIEQYRHATYKATDYYLEALSREPGDIRCNNAMGLWHLKRGKFSEAQSFFEKAISTLTDRNPNPYDSEPYFNLGLSFFYQEKYSEATDAFYKAAWTTAYQDSAYFNLARIAVRQNQLHEALDLIEKSLVRNYHHHSARHLKAAILRKLNRMAEANQWIHDSLAIDAFNFGCLFERCLLKSDKSLQKSAILELKKLSRGQVHTYTEYALDYGHAGLYEEATDLLNVYLENAAQPSPMAHYYQAYFYNKLNQSSLTNEHLERASIASSTYCFPNRIEDVGVLTFAIQHNTSDAKASYYLGNFWYAHRQYSDAIRCWEKSVTTDPNFSTVHRNLALAYHNKLNDETKALISLERAFALDQTDARVLMELDQLYKKLNRPYQQRLILLEKHLVLTEQRDDLYLERVSLYNLLQQYEKAKQLIADRKFHPWEGGEGKVVGQYLMCHIELAKQAITENRYSDALGLLEASESYPHNLGEGKLPGASENDIFYLKGCCYEALGQQKQAREYFTKSTIGLSEPAQAIYYNDQQPDKIFYQGLAWKKLGNNHEANRIFSRLIDFGEKHFGDAIVIDYFAVSLPDLLVFDQNLDLLNQIHCNYLIGLGCLGLGDKHLLKADEHFTKVLEKNCNHIGAAIHKNMIHESALY